MSLKEKGRYLTQSYDKSPQNNPQGQVKTQKRDQNFDYTTIPERLRTVSRGDDGYQTGVVKPFYGIPTSPLTATAVLSKGHTLKDIRDKKIQCILSL